MASFNARDNCAHRIVTIHNNPENLKPPDRYQHMRIEMPDIDVADITAHFSPTYNFIEEGRIAGQGEEVVDLICQRA